MEGEDRMPKNFHRTSTNPVPENRMSRRQGFWGPDACPPPFRNIPGLLNLTPETGFPTRHFPGSTPAKEFFHGRR